jgi:hypothetical protein
MAVVPDEFQAKPQGGLSQAVKPPPAPLNPTKAAMSATIDEEEAPVDPIEKASQKMALDREALNAQIDKLSKSLEARQNLPFNPMWLEVARAAAKPVSTGNAIEALGNIGGAYGDAYLKENQRQMDIGKDQMELLKQKQALSQAALEQELRASYVKGPQPKMMPAGAPAAPVGGAPSAPAMTGNAPTISPPPELAQSNRMRRVTDTDIAMLQGQFPKLAEELKGLSKLQREAQVVSPEGIWDTMSGSWVVKFQTNIERPIRVLGKQTMTKEASAQYDQMMDKLDRGGATEEQKDQAVAEFAAANGLGGVRKTDGQITGFQSASQKALADKEAELAVTNKAEENKASRTRVYEAGTRAQATKQSAQTLYKLSSDPERKGAFGVLNKPGVVNAIAVAIAQFLDKGSFGTAGLEQAVRTAGGTEKEIEAASYVASVQGHLQLMAAQDFLKGQGSVSDAERRLIANLVGSLSDTPKSVAMKAKVVEARANFDQLVADAFYEYEKKHPTGTVQDFYRAKDGEFKTLFKEYDDHMTSLYSHYFGSSKQNPVTPAESKVVKPAPNAPAGSAQGLTPKSPRQIGPLEQRIRDQKKAGT